jgi:hypothetical protein
MNVSAQASGMALSIQSVKRRAQETAQAPLARICDTFEPTDTVESAVRTLFDKAYHAEGMFLSGLLGGLFTSLATGLMGPMGIAGLGISAGLAVTGMARKVWFKARHDKLSKAASETASSLVSPGPKPGTYTDRRYYQAGVFTEASAVRSMATGETLSKRVQLQGPGSPVVVEENCLAGQLNVLRNGTSTSLSGRLELPTKTKTLTIQTIPSNGLGENRQTVERDGSSRLAFASLEAGGIVVADLSSQGRSSVAWANGAVIAGSRLTRAEVVLAPVIAPADLGAPVEPTGELPKPDILSPSGWVTGTFLGTESVPVGQSKVLSYRDLYRDFKNRNFIVRHHLYQDQSLSLIADGKSVPLAATLEDHQKLVYQAGPFQAKQDLMAPGRLQVETPEGGLLIDNDLIKGLRAQRYWGDQPGESVEVRHTEEGYFCQGVEIKPIIPKALLRLEGRDAAV